MLKGHYKTHNIVLILSITYTQLSLSSYLHMLARVLVYHDSVRLNTAKCTIINSVFKYCCGSLKMSVGRRNKQKKTGIMYVYAQVAGFMSN